MVMSSSIWMAPRTIALLCLVRANAAKPKGARVEGDVLRSAVVFGARPPALPKLPSRSADPYHPGRGRCGRDPSWSVSPNSSTKLQSALEKETQAVDIVGV